jgi:hypothetical protein
VMYIPVDNHICPANTSSMLLTKLSLHLVRAESSTNAESGGLCISGDRWCFICSGIMIEVIPLPRSR